MNFPQEKLPNPQDYIEILTKKSSLSEAQTEEIISICIDEIGKNENQIGPTAQKIKSALDGIFTPFWVVIVSSNETKKGISYECEDQNNNLDQLIKKIFPTDISFKRVQKEITMLKELNQQMYKISLQNSLLGLKIIVEVTQSSLESVLQDKSSITEPIFFEILLEHKFPFIFPKITCLTSVNQFPYFFDFIIKITTPTLHDGRDLLQDILKKKEVLAINRDIEGLQKMGQYYLGQYYNLEDFFNMKTASVFQGAEITAVKANPCFVVLTQLNFLEFELIQSTKNMVKLIWWANLKTLQNINKKNEIQSTIILTWKENNDSESYIQVFKIEETDKFLESVIQCMQLFGSKVHKNIIKKPVILKEDVSGEKFQNLNLKEHLDKTAQVEQILSQSLTIDTINELMSLYQLSIEYFSQLNNNEYNLYLDKLHILLQRKDVLALMDKYQEEQKEKNKNIDNEEEKKEITEQQKDETNKDEIKQENLKLDQEISQQSEEKALEQSQEKDIIKQQEQSEF